MKKYFYNLLLRSFDATLSAKEERRLNGELLESAKLRRMQKEIEHMRASLQSNELFSFKPLFVERTLRTLSVGQRSISDLYLEVFRAVAVGAAILVIVLTTYNMGRANAFTFESAFGVQQMSLEQAFTLEEPFQ